MKKTVLAAAVAAGVAFPAIASNEMTEILVTGTRTEKPLMYCPHAASLITSEEMKWKAAESLAEVLRDVPGLNVTDAGQAGMKRIRIRGEDSYRVAVLIDGQEITDHRGEGVPLTLDPALVEQVEVVKGAGSVLYGPKALGGVVNFITRKGGEKPFHLTASTGYDSATKGEQYFASVYGTVADFDYRVSYAKDQQGNRQTPEGEVENTESASDSVSLYLGKRWGNHELALSWDDHNAYSEVFVEDEVRFLFPFNEFAMNIPQRDREKIGLLYTWEKPAERIEKMQFNAYRQTSDRQFETYWSQVFGMEKETFSQSELVTDGALAQVDFRLLDNHYVIAGVQYTRDEVEQDRQEYVDNIPVPFPPFLLSTFDEIYDEATLETHALFIQDEWQVTEDIAITAGARQYWVDAELEESTRPGLITPPKDDNEMIASLAVTWEVAENSVLRASFSEGYMYPSLLNLAIGGVARTYVNPNSGLEPEKSDTFELGWRYSRENLELDITAFRTEAENYIDHVPCVPEGPWDSCIGGTRRTLAEVYVNIGDATTTGVEAALEYSLSDAVTLYSSLTWLRREGRFEDFSKFGYSAPVDDVSTYKTGLPSVSGVVGLKYSGRMHGVGNYWLDLYARGESGSDELEVRFPDVDETDPVIDFVEHHNDGWVTANLSAGFEFGENSNYRLVLEMKNLFDKTYSSATENLLAPERSVHANFVVDF